MNILMVTNKMDIGGAETHILELSKKLKNMGNEVTIASDKGVYLKDLEKIGINHIKVPMQSKNPFNIIKSYMIIKDHILINKYDIVHSHARIPSLICSILCRKLSIPFVTTAHYNFRLLFWRYLTKWGDKTIAVSNDIKKYLIDNYKIKEDNIYITVNGIDQVRFNKDIKFEDIIEEFNIDISKKQIVYISRLDKDRSLVAEQCINIAEEIYKKYNDVRFIIVGGGDRYNTILKAAEEINLKAGLDLIKIIGPRTDINKFCNLAYLFIGVSRAALEAMSCEKNVILGSNDGYMGLFNKTLLNKGLENNFTCRGFGQSSETILKDDIIKFLKIDNQNLSENGKYNKEVVEKFYSTEKMAIDTLTAYNDAIKEHKNKLD